MLTEKQLLEKKKEIEAAKQALAELKGEEKALLKNLKEEYNVASLQDAKKLLQSKKSKMEELSEDLDKMLQDIEDKYF